MCELWQEVKKGPKKSAPVTVKKESSEESESGSEASDEEV